MSTVIESRDRPRFQHGDKADSRPTKDGELKNTTFNPSHSNFEIDIGDIRHQQKIQEIPNNAIVTFKFGKPHQIKAYGGVFDGHRVISRGKIPGSNTKLPPVHFLTENEFDRLVSYADSGLNAIREPSDDTYTAAWWDPSSKVIEVGVPGTNGKSLSHSIKMTGLGAKLMLGLIIHEAMHGDSKHEFLAFRAQYDFLFSTGAISKPKSHLEIMIEIARNYDEDSTSVADAQDEFLEACKQDGCRDQEEAYWKLEEQRIERLELFDTD